MFAIVTGFGLTAIAQLIEGLSVPLQLAGGVLLVCFGLYTYFSKPPKLYDPKCEITAAKAKAPSSLVRAMASTFALTITNPATLLGFTAMFTGLGGLGRRRSEFLQCGVRGRWRDPRFGAVVADPDDAGGSSARPHR